MDLLSMSAEQSGEFVRLRRDIHRHPELGFEENRTSALVAEKLQAWGYQVERGLGGTGVVGQLRRGGSARRLGLRADMDALPIQEATGLAHASCRPGLMHACGHDGHTAMLLAAARLLAATDFDGTLNLVFQPAEESLGGAVRMIEDGLFDKYPCDAIFSMHNMPGIAQGRLVLREGAMMASSDYVTITLHGTGGHGAMPHHTADPIVAAASIVMALQSIVARNVDPLQTAVVTVGAVHAGQANNVIPQQARLELSVRALDREVRALLQQRIRDLVTAQAQSYGVRAEIDYRSGYTVLVNDAAQTALAREVALELLGPQRVELQGPPLTGSEDFAFMLERVPGSYVLIGNGDGQGNCMVHNPGYDFNDDNIAIGAAFWVKLAQRFLEPGAG
ncbi:M20 aminoacylase family protein [Azohydromonas australica]|uniref:M20 aminoacylase family protein n=1 Tax=Azohydromonas australica TaxID=364039 RepID=UPI0004095846|nr:M20 aminoacylase family protein [Azohydromonas australica]